MPKIPAAILACLAVLSAAADRPTETAPVAPAADAVPSHGIPAARNPGVYRALNDWLKSWRKGRILVFVNPDSPQGKGTVPAGSLLKKYRLEPPGLLGKMTAQRELEILLELCAEIDDANAAQMLLQFAGLGLDGERYTATQAPHTVREMAQQAIAQLQSTEAKQYILDVARGEETMGRRNRAMAHRAGAIHALGQFDDAAFRPAIESGLAAEEPEVRRAAAQGLAARPNGKSVRPLVDALAKETEGAALLLMISTLQACMEAADDGISQTERRLAIEAAIEALGRTGWRGDLALVEFLARFRSAEAIPALIEVLESFEDADDKIRSGELSTILQYAAFDALRSLTGAMFPADQPEQWRRFWEENKEGFELPGSAGSQGESETKGAFFGIPVKGSRIVFIVDLSGSMEVPADMRGSDPIEGVDEPTRWDQAKREILAAVERLPDVAFFNVVNFSTDADQWQKNLQPAAPKTKALFARWLDKLRPGGGTNLWAALERGLAMQGFAGEDRFDAPVDEIFVVSDGAPSWGEVVDPLEILELVQESNRFAKIRINTIFIDSPLPRGMVMQTPEYSISPQEMMKRMAESNSGTFVQIGKTN